MNFWVYILTNQRHTTMQIGLTTDIRRRLGRSRSDHNTKFRVNKLVYLEQLDNPVIASVREKQLQRMPRLRKEVLINKRNPAWLDLSSSLAQVSLTQETLVQGTLVQGTKQQ